VAALAHEGAVHVDGARPAQRGDRCGVAADVWGGLVDTVWIDFTKGLGVPSAP
jgi:threonine aldolase